MPKRAAAKKKPSKKPSRFYIPYPLMLCLLLCAGVFLAAWSFGVKADDLLVTASVKGSPITAKAVINTPADGSHFTAVPLTVTGSCPPNAAYIEIYDNGIMAGSTICEASSTFQLQINLLPGANELTAHSFNVTDDEGPVSDRITVYYDVPPPAEQPGNSGQAPGQSGSGSSGSPHTPPLLLKTAFVYKGYYVNQPISWPIEISGGTAPYALHVDWGDATDSVISRKSSGQFNLEHTYKHPGGYHGSYTIKIQATDADGNYAYLEFFVIVNAKTSQSVGSIYNKPPPSLNNLRSLLWVAWPAYASVVVMVVMFKLGESQELIHLRHQGRLKRT
jgi:hypothetical protein